MKQWKVVLFLHFLAQVLQNKNFLKSPQKKHHALQTHTGKLNEISLMPEENLHLSGYFYIGQANLTLRSQDTNEK